MSLAEVLQLLRSGWDVGAESDRVQALAARLDAAVAATARGGEAQAEALRTVATELVEIGLEDGAVEGALRAALVAWREAQARRAAEGAVLAAAAAAARRAYVEATVPRSLSLSCPRCKTAWVMERRDHAMGIRGLALSCLLCGLDEDAVDGGMPELRQRWRAL